MLTAEQIQKNWEKHLKIIDHYLTGTRKQKVVDMVNTFGDRYVLAPASTKSWYHNAFPGGYVDHVNRVVEFSLRQNQLYSDTGGEVDYTTEELVFAALFHDLGKMGDSQHAYYLPQNDKWRQDKLNETYTNNPELDYMLVQDRSLFTLQSHGIPVNQKEYLAIRLHDGIYDEANKAYFLTRQPTSRMKTNIVNILHVADYLASKVEYDILKRFEQSNKNQTSPVEKKQADLLKNI